LDTVEHKLHRTDGSVVDTQFMSSSKDQHIAVHDGFKVLTCNTIVPATRTTIPPSRYYMCVFPLNACDSLWRLEDRMVSSPSFVRDHLLEERVLGPQAQALLLGRHHKGPPETSVMIVFKGGADLPG
jgi:hypothetical protein